MSSQTAEVLVWTVLVTVALLCAAGIVAAVRRKLRHRARYLHFLRASQARERTCSAPSPLTGGMTPGLAQAVRRHAERTAARHWRADQGHASPANPYQQGTPQHVLWYASYELALYEFMDGTSANVVELGGR